MCRRQSTGTAGASNLSSALIAAVDSARSQWSNKHGRQHRVIYKQRCTVHSPVMGSSGASYNLRFITAGRPQPWKIQGIWQQAVQLHASCTHVRGPCALRRSHLQACMLACSMHMWAGSCAPKQPANVRSVAHSPGIPSDMSPNQISRLELS